MNYFEWFDLPVKFLINAEELKKIYISKSRKLHPDYFGNAIPAEKDEALKLTTFNNEAFEILSNENKRQAYIFSLHGLGDEKKNLSNLFLMDMMELNEELETLQENFSQEKYNEIKNIFDEKYNELNEIIFSLSEKYDVIKEKEILEQLHTKYLEKKYLLRLQTTLNTFAPSK